MDYMYRVKRVDVKDASSRLTSTAEDRMKGEDTAEGQKGSIENRTGDVGLVISVWRAPERGSSHCEDKVVGQVE